METEFDLQEVPERPDVANKMCRPLFVALRHLKILRFVFAALQRQAPQSAADKEELSPKTLSATSLRR